MPACAASDCTVHRQCGSSCIAPSAARNRGSASTASHPEREQVPFATDDRSACTSIIIISCSARAWVPRPGSRNSDVSRLTHHSIVSRSRPSPKRMTGGSALRRRSFCWPASEKKPTTAKNSPPPLWITMRPSKTDGLSDPALVGSTGAPFPIRKGRPCVAKKHSPALTSNDGPLSSSDTKQFPWTTTKTFIPSWAGIWIAQSPPASSPAAP